MRNSLQPTNQPTKQTKWPEYSLGEWGWRSKEKGECIREPKGVGGQASSHSSLYWACRVIEEGQHRGGAPDSRAVPLSDLAQLLRGASCVAVTSCQVSHP